MAIACQLWLLLLLLAAWLPASAASRKTYQGYKVYSVLDTTNDDVHWLMHLATRHHEHMDILSEPLVSDVQPTVEVAVGPRLQTRFLQLCRRRNLTAVETVHNLKTLLDDERERLVVKDEQLLSPSTSDVDGGRSRREAKTPDADRLLPLDARNFNTSVYHSYGPIQSWLLQLESVYPSLVSVLHLNRTTLGVEITGVKAGVLTLIGLSRPTPKPVVWIDGGMHAREWIAVSSVIYIIHALTQGYVDGNETVINLLHKFDFHIVPVANPDGYVYSHTQDRLWRKTRSRSDDVDCIGVDPNRNWDFHWAEGEHLLRSPCSQIYAGEAAFSEPEVRSISHHLLTHKRQLRLYLSMHAYGQVILGPWGYKKELPVDFLKQKDCAESAIEAIRATSGKRYSFGTISNLLYVAAGTSIDFVHVHGVPYSYGFELRPRNTALQDKLARLSNKQTGSNATAGHSATRRNRRRLKRNRITSRRSPLQSSFIVEEDEILPTGAEVFAAVQAMATHIAIVQQL